MHVPILYPQVHPSPNHHPQDKESKDVPTTSSNSSGQIATVATLGGDEETEKGCKLIDEMRETIDSKKPPVYSEQGQPKGRKAKAKAKAKTGKGKVSPKKAKTGKGKGKGKKRGSKALGNLEILRSASSHSVDGGAADTSKTEKPKRCRKATEPKPDGPTAKRRKRSTPATVPPVEPNLVPATEAAAPATVPNTEVAAPELPPADPAVEAAASAADPNPDSALPEEEIPQDAIAAPSFVTTNQVYSNAYKKVKYQGGDCEAAKKAGKKATALLRDLGLVSPALSGMPKERKPKAPKEAVNENEENAHK